MFDIVIPLGPNDRYIIHKQLEYTKKNVIGYRNIYVVSYNTNIQIDDKDIIVIDEQIFPFSKDDVSNLIERKDRAGWYLQQLIKLYAVYTIPDIMETILVIDADTFFTKPTDFFKDGKFCYNYGDEFHKPYFEHMKRLHPYFFKNSTISGICHHMIFQKKYLDEIMFIIEAIHNDKFWKVFLKNADPNEISGASEYEIYFNYMLTKHRSELCIRKLNFINTSYDKFNYFKDRYDYVSCHHYYNNKYEPNKVKVIDTFLKVLEKNKYDFNKKINIFDIGSRDCSQSNEFADSFPNANVYAFECNPSTIPICINNIIDNPRITLIDKAVNTYDGTCKFYPINPHKTITTWKDGNPGASSLFKSNGSYTIEHYVQDEIEIPCTRLDTMMNKLKINTANIIWIDLQGAELLAFKSMGDLLKNTEYIHTEISYKAIYENQVLFQELDSYLKSNGFININKPSYSGWQEDIIYRNVNLLL